MNKQQLANKIWASANKMRSKIEANEYKDYILGLIFYKYECPHVPKLAKFKPPRCPIGVYWNTLCLMRDVWTIKTYMI